jgi:hypothetical protein
MCAVSRVAELLPLSNPLPDLLPDGPRRLSSGVSGKLQLEFANDRLQASEFALVWTFATTDGGAPGGGSYLATSVTRQEQPRKLSTRWASSSAIPLRRSPPSDTGVSGIPGSRYERFLSPDKRAAPRAAPRKTPITSNDACCQIFNDRPLSATDAQGC